MRNGDPLSLTRTHPGHCQAGILRARLPNYDDQLLQMVLRLLQESTALWWNEHHKRNHSVDPEHGTYNKKNKKGGGFQKSSVCVFVCGAHVVVQRGEMSSIMHAEHLHTLFSVVCDDG